MTDANWKADDLALCIREGTWIQHGFGPRKGQVIPVADVLGLDSVVVVGPRSHPCYLEFSEWGREFTFGCGNFIKIQPLDDLERLRAETDFHVTKNLARAHAKLQERAQ